MLRCIVSKNENSGQAAESRLEPIAFTVQSIIPALSQKGFALLPGLIHWLNVLNPLNNLEAWQTFSDKYVSEMIRTLPQQQRRFLINDSGKLDDGAQLGVNFEAKRKKSHLTILEGSDVIADYPRLPNAVRIFLKDNFEFIACVRELCVDILPPMSLPTILKVRIFEYHPSSETEAMRPHVDGSVLTLILAKSDGLLCLAHNGQWHRAMRLDQKPFALVIPGVAAHDFNLTPTPHLVLGSEERRISVTVFLTPALCGNRYIAEHQMKRWKLEKTSDELSFAV